MLQWNILWLHITPLPSSGLISLMSHLLVEVHVSINVPCQSCFGTVPSEPTIYSHIHSNLKPIPCFCMFFFRKRNAFNKATTIFKHCCGCCCCCCCCCCCWLLLLVLLVLLLLLLLLLFSSPFQIMPRIPLCFSRMGFSSDSSNGWGHKALQINSRTYIWS